MFSLYCVGFTIIPSSQNNLEASLLTPSGCTLSSFVIIRRQGRSEVTVKLSGPGAFCVSL